MIIEVSSAPMVEKQIYFFGRWEPNLSRYIERAGQRSGTFLDLGAKWFVPMHYGSFKLSFEPMDVPPRWLQELATQHGVAKKLCILEEGVPQLF